MFHWLGHTISRTWPLWLVAWAVFSIGSWAFAPAWETVAIDHDDTLLKRESPSRRAEQLFRQAFPDELAASNIVVVLHRPGSNGQFLEPDKKFVGDVLEPALRKIAGLTVGAKPVKDDPFASDPPAPAATGPVRRLRTPNAPSIGDLLVSPDREAMLVTLELTNGFMAEANAPVIAAVEQLLAKMRSDKTIPNGLQVEMTGSAVVGRDQRVAERESAHSTEKLTIGLVIVLLLMIYRSPVLAIIPLLTVAIGVKAALSVLAILAHYDLAGLFPGIQVYITVLSYGAGVDFTLFLIARYKEGVDDGLPLSDSVAAAIAGVGSTITCSALTVVLGLGTLAFAEFGKFRQAGVAIACSISLVWLASLTLSPALLRLAGRWTFWPRGLGTPTASLRPEPSAAIADPCAKVYPRKIRDGWETVARVIACRPATVLVITAASLVPFAAVALVFHDRLSYNLVSNLPATSPSVAGTRALNAHFAAGVTGPVSVLVVNPNYDFRKSAGRELIASLTERLRNKRDELGLDDVRSLTAPLGIGPAASSATPEAVESAALENYVSDMGERGGHATRLDFVFREAPFGDSAISAVARVEGLLNEVLPSGSEIHSFGTVATVRDLQKVMRRDRGRIEMYVLAAVFVVLLVLLRQFVVPVYLLLSVLLSYYAALGMTFAVFWALDPTGFAGIDWKVTVFLYAILIAVGEDYNIFLVSRVAEEQAKHGPVRGVSIALVRTGPIISSCGVIMAGTFASLIAGSLKEMQQLGFALAFGVMLDTFVVRPVLVPAFLILFYGRKHRSNESSINKPGELTPAI